MSNHGRVYRPSNKKNRLPYFGHLGKKDRRFYVRYDYVLYRVSILVTAAFHGPKPFDRAEAIHIDENSMNNRADNLRWATHKENHSAPKYKEIKRAQASARDTALFVAAGVPFRFGARLGNRSGRLGVANHG